MNGSKVCKSCGQISEPEYADSCGQNIGRLPFMFVDPKIALINKQFSLQTTIQDVYNQNAKNPLVSRLIPYTDAVIKQVSLYMSQFKFKAPTAIQFAVIMLAEESNEDRTQIQKLFGFR